MLFLSAPAIAIEWPLSLADAKQYGENTTTMAIIADAPYRLLSATDRSPSATIITPFKLAAFVFAKNKATYADPTPRDLQEIKADVSLTVIARAFSTIIRTNDDMVVVIKQSGKIIRSSSADRPDVSVTEYPEVGYDTTISFKFPLAALDLREPMKIVVANAVVDGAIGKAEASWTVDPATIR